MAGGPNAAAMLCTQCLGKANRIAEGLEDDYYQCERCGNRFGVDWRRGKPAAPLWPPTEPDRKLAQALLDARSREKPP